MTASSSSYRMGFHFAFLCLSVFLLINGSNTSAQQNYTASRLVYITLRSPNLDHHLAFWTDFGLHHPQEPPGFHGVHGQHAQCGRYEQSAFQRALAGSLINTCRVNDMVLQMYCQRDQTHACVRVIRAPEVPAAFIGFGIEVHRLRKPTTIMGPNYERIELLPRSERAATSWRSDDTTAETNYPRLPRSSKVEVPTVVERLGHVVLNVRNMKAALAFYTQVLGMLVTDAQYLHNDTSPIVAFLRFDRGSYTPTDHHSVALVSLVHAPVLEALSSDTFRFGRSHANNTRPLLTISSQPPVFHLLNHAAFQVSSVHAVIRGGLFLTQQQQHQQRLRGERAPLYAAYRSWGLGVHLLGSQVFDYWRVQCAPEESSYLFEYFAGGDRMTSTYPARNHSFHSGASYVAGPAMTADFTGLNRPWTIVKMVWRRLVTERYLTPSKKSTSTIEDDQNDLTLLRLFRIVRSML